MRQTLTIDFNRPLPLFPLPDCMLLPQGTVPLHVFEHRYRKMTWDVLDRHGLIAMAVFRGEDWKQDYEGKPPLRPYVCVGYVLHHEKLDDGRYNLLLHGVSRAQIKTEVPSEPYRMALLEPVLPSASSGGYLAQWRQRMESLLEDPLLEEVPAVRVAKSWRRLKLPTEALIDLMCAAGAGAEERYKFLAERDASTRARWLEENLSRKLEKPEGD